MPTVFVPSLPTRWDEEAAMRVPTINISAALAFGSPRILVPAEVNLTVLDSALDVLAQRMVDEFNIGDYVLAAGDPVLIGATIHHASNLSAGRPVRVLRWNRLIKSYQSITL